MIDRTIAVSAHGRYLVHAPGGDGRWPVLMGFHGYAEAAEAQLERLREIPGSDRWLLVAVQGLNRFYRGRSQDVVAGWMTRQDRELAIPDNVAYVRSTLEALSREFRTSDRLVLAGFSQGVAMAFRAAAAGGGRVISLGGDVPPELDRLALAKISAVLLARGEHDDWYTQEKFEADVNRLRSAGCPVEPVTLAAAHEWTDDFSRAAGSFLERWT